MKAIWTIVCILALANLLAILAFGGWLAATGRLDGSRLRAARAVLAETIAQARAREEKTQADAKAAAEAAAAEARKLEIPQTASERITTADDSDEVRRQRLERLKREVEDLQRTLSRGREELEAGWAKLEGEKKAFDEMRARVAALEGSEQFEKALKLYETLKPQQAQAMMQQLIDQGEVEQAVAYLNAMQTRTASKIIAEFKDPALATDLLERLRTRGLEARGKTLRTSGPPQEPPKPDASARAQPAATSSPRRSR